MKALAISICAHVAILWMCSLQAFNDYGIANAAKSRTPASRSMVVKLIPGDSPAKPLQSQPPMKNVSDANAPDPAPELPAEVAMANTSDSSNSENKSDFIHSGHLSRAPFPLEDIDLNSTSIDEVAVVGSIELTILIDEAGNVVDVVTPDYPSGASIFADRVATRFRAARFAPGEIDGVHVKSRLQITVVSEPQLEAVRN